MLNHSVLNVLHIIFRNNKQNITIFYKHQFLYQTFHMHTSGGGAAIWLSQSVGNIYKSGLYYNYASFWGGSILLSRNSLLLISHTMFENNVAGVFGGAISSYNSSMNVEYSTFENYSALNKDIGFGGGLFLTVNCTAKILQVRFSKCHARYGGAIATNFTKIIMTNSSLTANTGSAICLLRGTLMTSTTAHFLIILHLKVEEQFCV